MSNSEQIKKQQPVFEEIEDWPIYRLYRNRKGFIEEIDQFATERILAQTPGDLEDMIAKTIFQERIRIKEEPWKVDPPTDRQLWNRIRNSLLAGNMEEDAAKVREDRKPLLTKIVHRYSSEIAGGFSKRMFKFARKFLYFFFNRLLNAVAKGRFGIFRSKHKLHERLQVYGEIQSIQELFKHGTVVVVPTHFSNLDSVLVGYAMDEVLGLPSFSYGAGLNLYNFGPAAYFMNRLGAYRVDRRKKNPIYLETLKAFSLLSIFKGVNSLFFPGGTRSRSGSLENRLKLGLLGTTVEAQRMLSQEGSNKKVFLVPLVLSYHFVLEAPGLIEQHLKTIGKERYLKGRDASTSVNQWVRFFWNFFRQQNDIVLHFGRPMDVLGNSVDDSGRSIDQKGNVLTISDYFKNREGVVNEDLQREEEYTKILADRIIGRYKTDNIVLHSHLVAFVAFRLLMAHHPKLDLFELLRLPDDDYSIPYNSLCSALEETRTALAIMAGQGRLHLNAELHRDLDYVIKDGVRRMGMFHINKPLRINRLGDIFSEDFHTLCYYHNRLLGYGLENKIQWERFPIQVRND
jgi:glycerol-3-phosphate O-acyltransferase